LGNVRVTDFGMTRLLQTEADRPIPQVITGSIGYLSPEQMKERSVLTVSSDIYSLGILLYEMLTGNLPGRRSPLPSEVNKDVPKDIDDLFDKMTRDAPKERYPDIDSVLSDFYSYFKDGTYLTKGKIILYAGSEPAGAAADSES
jgi:serine/threonine protein kinase